MAVYSSIAAAKAPKFVESLLRFFSFRSTDQVAGTVAAAAASFSFFFSLNAQRSP